ncbi:glycoside hydrolase family 44 protein [uncultured Victivallis sp.]|uniref:glycoside hydrolase family 44 protein n=1 Tax=uncultured Victivallis sp. TaxID=354118 RepID=UPI0025CC1597|nr:glycoside hydrolase family 44 protein [uncultured Victivallis sp.]
MIHIGRKSITTVLLLLLAVLFAGNTAAAPAELELRKVPDSTNCTPILRNGNYLYAAGGKGLSVYDLSTPAAPRLVKRLPDVSGRQMAMQNNRLYITARGQGLWIFDLADPAEPRLLTRFDTVELATGIAVTGNIVFVAQRIYGVEILDCTIPEKPRHIGLIRGGEIQSVAFHNNLLYCGSWGHGRITIWNVADLKTPKRVGSFQLDGYGDGMAVRGNYCYAATGMDAKTGPKEARKNRGHGLEIFDISDPARPRRVGGVKFPPSPTMFFDSWTVTVSGTTAYVADTINGIYLVNVADPARPEILAQGKLPDCWKKPNPVGSLAIGEGVLYVAGLDGLYITPWAEAKPPQLQPEPVPGETKGAPKEFPGFQRIDVNGQVRRLFLEQDTLYAACSHQGLRTWRVTEQGLVPQNHFPLACSYDVAVRDGRIYSAEGVNGLAIYRITPEGKLEELGRDPATCLYLRTVSNPRFLICTTGGMTLFVKDVSDPKKIRTVLKQQVRGIFYTDTTADRELGGLLPVNCHAGGILWLDLRGEVPEIKYHYKRFLAAQNSAPAALNGRFLFPATAKKGVVLLNPATPDQVPEQVMKIKGFPSPEGTVSTDGSIAVFTRREWGSVTTVDFTDPEHPAVIPGRSIASLPGSPGRALFWRGRLLIPAGHYGILFETAANSRKRSAAARPSNGEPWENLSTRFTNQNRELLLYCGSTRTGSVRDMQKSGLPEASVQEGMLLLNTERFRKAFPGKTLDFYYPLTAQPGKEVVLEAELAGPEGATVDLFFEGRTDRHYWKKKTISLKSTPALYRFETKFPENLKHVSCRITFQDLPFLKIGRITCTVKQDDRKVDPRANFITNGGAERGFYNVYPPSEVRIAKPSMKVAVDDGEFHSGKHSFRLEPVKNGFNRLVFNAVPYQIGKPLVFSMYLKAEKPKTAVSLGFFTHHGAAYLRTVSVGTEWKKYELAVPSFGDSAPGVIKIGNPAMTESFHHVSPIVTPAGKVWLDDATCQPALKSTEMPPPAIALSGKLESEHGYFYAGKPFRGTIQLDAAAGAKSCRLNWELRNWRGEVVAAGKTPESIAVPGKKPFSITPPANVLGPVNLIFTAMAEDGKAYTHTFYTGILRSPGKSLTRWGTNVHTSPQDDAFTIRLFRDFGLGAVRLWAKPNEPECGGFRSATRFHDAGFLVMVNISGHTPQAPFYIPKDARSLITGHFKEAILQHRGKVDYYELFNEPEIWGGRTTNPDPAKYNPSTPESCAAATVQMAQAIRELDPQAKIAGPGCHIKPEFLEAYLKAGAAKMLDALTEHPYRQLPELPDLETAQQEFQAALKRYRPDLPILSSESGNMNFPTLPDNRIHPLVVQYAARDLRYALIEFACGVKSYFHFQSTGIDLGYAWTSVLGDPDHHWVPAPFLYAVRNAADLLGEAPVVDRVRLGANKRCYIFDKGSERIAALWQWEGTPETLEFARKADFCDMMGSSFSAKKIRLDEFPVYLRSTLPVTELKQFLASARQTGVENPLRYSVELCDANTFGIRLRNVTTQTLTGSVECAGERKTFKIYGEKTELLKFRAPAPISRTEQQLKMKLRIDGFRDAEHTIALRGMMIPAARNEIKIDGDLADWPAETAPVTLDFRNARTLLPWSKADQQIRAELRFAWSPAALYCAVTVHRDAFHPEERFGKMAIWRGDSLQFGIDTMKNATPETKGFQSDDFEYLIGEFQKKPLVWRLAASSVTWDSFAKEIGEIDDVKLAIRHQPGKTIYEMAFSPVAVSPFRLIAGSSCRLNVLVNLSDGTRRIGWLQLSRGMGDNPFRPAEFLDVALAK